MFLGEIAAQRLKELNTSKIPNVKTPVVWSGLEIPNGRLDEIFSRQEVNIFGDIPIETLPALGPVLFAGKKSLTDTVSTIAGKPILSIDGLRGSTLQIGKKAHILFYEALVEGTSYYFVTYLSKGAKGTPLGAEAEQDFNDLKSLSRQFRDRLKDEAREQYDVVDPIALDYINYKKKNYTFFTMPFLPLGELHSDIIPVQDGSRTITTIPFIHYIAAYTEEMKIANSMQDEAARDVARSHPHWGTADLPINPMEGGRWIKQRDDILRGEALIHLVSGSFPREHQLNAGDWMGEISGDRITKLRLITVRGGFDNPLTKTEFFSRLQELTEVAFVTLRHIKTFNNVKDDDLERIYQEAMELLR